MDKTVVQHDVHAAVEPRTMPTPTTQSMPVFTASTSSTMAAELASAPTSQPHQSSTASSSSRLSGGNATQPLLQVLVHDGPSASGTVAQGAVAYAAHDSPHMANSSSPFAAVAAHNSHTATGASPSSVACPTPGQPVSLSPATSGNIGLGFEPVAWHIGQAESPRFAMRHTEQQQSIQAEQHQQRQFRASWPGGMSLQMAEMLVANAAAVTPHTPLPLGPAADSAGESASAQSPMEVASWVPSPPFPAGDNLADTCLLPSATVTPTRTRANSAGGSRSRLVVDGTCPAPSWQLPGACPTATIPVPGPSWHLNASAFEGSDTDGPSRACTVVIHDMVSEAGSGLGVSQVLSGRSSAMAVSLSPHVISPATGVAGTAIMDTANLVAAPGAMGAFTQVLRAGAADAVALGRGVGAGASPFRLEPVPEHTSSFFTAQLLRQVPGWLEQLWDVVEQALLVCTIVMDAVMIQHLISAGCGAPLWAPAICFMVLPTLCMAMVLLANNGWLALCFRWFSLMAVNNDLSALFQEGSTADFVRSLSVLSMLCLMTLLSCLVAVYCYALCTGAALACIPLLDISSIISALAPNSRCFRQKDLLFLENYKCARLPTQALLQSVPQSVLLIYVVASHGCSASTAILAAALALALINVLSKSVRFFLMSTQHYSGHSHAKIASGLRQQAQDMLALQGASKVPGHVLDRRLMRMLRSQSDFIVSEGLADDEGQDSTSSGVPVDNTVASGHAVEHGWTAFCGRLCGCGSKLSSHIPLVPGFLIPCRSSELVPGQVATLVREAFARYPNQGITTWALEYPSGDRCLGHMIRDGLSHFRSLQHLTICKCKLDGRGFQEAASQVLCHPQLRTLRFIKVDMDIRAAGAIADLLNDNSPIAMLEVRGCTIAPRATLRLARALHGNTRLRTLLYTSTAVNKQGAQAFAEALQSNRTLRHLDLSGNKLGPQGAQALAEALATCRGTPQLRLVVSSIDVGQQGCKFLVDALIRRRRQQIAEALQQQQQEQHRRQQSASCWDDAEDPPSAEHAAVPGCFGAMICGGSNSGSRAESFMGAAQGSMAAASAAAAALPGGASPRGESLAGSRSQSTRGCHQRTHSEPTRLAVFAAALLGAGGIGPGSRSVAPAPPAADISIPLRVDVHSCQGGCMLVHGLPLMLVGGPAGAGFLESLLPGTDVEERELEELEQQGQQGRDGIKLVLLQGALDADLVTAACSCYRILDGLVELDLSGLGISDAGALVIATAIRECPTLAAVDLSRNAITDVGVKVLAAELASITSLHFLDLSGNQICDEGARALASMMTARAAAAVPACPAVGSAAAAAAIDASSAHVTGCHLVEASDEGEDSVIMASRGGAAADAPAAAAAADPSPAAEEAATSGAGGGVFSALLHLPFMTGSTAAAAPAAPAPAAAQPLPPLHIRLCDNHYPFSMEALKELQSALHQAQGPPAAPSTGAALAGEAAAGVILEMVRLPTPQLADTNTDQQQSHGFPNAWSASEGCLSAWGNRLGRPAILPVSTLPAGLSSGVGTSRHARMPSHTSQASDGSDSYAGCGVCFDNPNSLIIRDCGHKLCVQCYRHLVKPDAKKSATCPFCRAPISGYDYRGWPHAK